MVDVMLMMSFEIYCLAKCLNNLTSVMLWDAEIYILKPVKITC